MKDSLIHYGIKRRSGRYPWGSGKDPHSRSKDIIGMNDDLKSKGYSESDIAKQLGLTQRELRSRLSIANDDRKQQILDSVKSKKARGMTDLDISKELGISESSVRNYKKQIEENKVNKYNQRDNISEALRQRVDTDKYIDIGKGVNEQMGVSKYKMDAVISQLKQEGYYVHNIDVKQLTGEGWTTMKILSKEPDEKIIVKNRFDIKPAQVWTEDGGITMQGLKSIIPVSADKVKIRYDEQGGSDKDGLIEIRRGAKDLDLGESTYAQVRIQIGKGHYLKGMAVYSDDIPKGYDIIFNTNKSEKTPKLEVMKKLEDNPDNPFGAYISRQKGALNILSQEGDWDGWANKFSSQFLSKQPLALVNDRIMGTQKRVNAEIEDILNVKNPTARRLLLEQYSDTLVKQQTKLQLDTADKYKAHVIIPMNLKSNEIYAPNYKNGDVVVLVRYPHGGTFEIPQLIVNNRGKNQIQNAVDAVGINSKVAAKLSGADFDGDTVYIINNNSKKIKSSPSLKTLENFDPKEYKVDHVTISPRHKQKQMGIVSNLITDMTIKGATTEEIGRAVRHSMVVIDSEKHKLDWKNSARYHGIAALSAKYQRSIDPITGKPKGGASTLISRSGSEIRVLNEKTGRLERKPLISQVEDARKLSSGTPVENLYAGYANYLKNKSASTKTISETIKDIPQDKNKSKEYLPEIQSLRKKIADAVSKHPNERAAQLMANKEYQSKIKQYPDKYDNREAKNKLKDQVLASARVKTGRTTTDEYGNKRLSYFKLTDKEWEAINSNAVSPSLVKQVFKHVDSQSLKEKAMPRAAKNLAPSTKARLKAMMSKGYTRSEISEALGLSIKTINDNI